ncbi:uncharacterized protein HKW66_Vig0143220 [Vigna angularis]|uniref:Uncharacterized protein n=1 Tax=Phaseolus angularis TaxID=3914 RepID=A0A8T0KEV5_PHAAN|nr:uncharacterized protein LOC108339412 [Vigna angularis]KAG2397442.1 uncharacterized protein HKW66_Vig0143220 [Vigna angularis]
MEVKTEKKLENRGATSADATKNIAAAGSATQHCTVLLHVLQPPKCDKEHFQVLPLEDKAHSHDGFATTRGNMVLPHTVLMEQLKKEEQLALAEMQRAAERCAGVGCESFSGGTSTRWGVSTGVALSISNACGTAACGACAASASAACAAAASPAGAAVACAVTVAAACAAGAAAAAASAACSSAACAAVPWSSSSSSSSASAWPLN